MRYVVSVSITCVAAFDDDARESLRVAISLEPGEVVIDDPAVRGAVVVEATLRGTRPA